jgi:hypothetical protein
MRGKAKNMTTFENENNNGSMPTEMMAVEPQQKPTSEATTTTPQGNFAQSTTKDERTMNNTQHEIQVVVNHNHECGCTYAVCEQLLDTLEDMEQCPVCLSTVSVAGIFAGDSIDISKAKPMYDIPFDVKGDDGIVYPAILCDDCKRRVKRMMGGNK